MSILYLTILCFKTFDIDIEITCYDSTYIVLLEMGRSLYFVCFLDTWILIPHMQAWKVEGAFLDIVARGRGLFDILGFWNFA